MKKLSLFLFVIISISSSAHYGCCNPINYSIQYNTEFIGKGFKYGKDFKKEVKKLPRLKFYESKDLKGRPYAQISDKGVIINNKKLCSLVKVNNSYMIAEFLLDSTAAISEAQALYNLNNYSDIKVIKYNNCMSYPLITLRGTESSFSFWVEADKKISKELYSLKLNGKRLYFKPSVGVPYLVQEPARFLLKKAREKNPKAFSVFDSFKSCVNSNDYACSGKLKNNHSEAISYIKKKQRDPSSDGNKEIKSIVKKCINSKNLIIAPSRQYIGLKIKVVHHSGVYRCDFLLKKEARMWKMRLDVWLTQIDLGKEETSMYYNNLVQDYENGLSKK